MYGNISMTAAAACCCCCLAHTGTTHTGKARSSYKSRSSSVLPAAARKVTAAEAGDAGQLASLMQLKAALDPDGVLDKVRYSCAGLTCYFLVMQQKQAH
jgi:hypothetical protein